MGGGVISGGGGVGVEGVLEEWGEGDESGRGD